MSTRETQLEQTNRYVAEKQNCKGNTEPVQGEVVEQGRDGLLQENGKLRTEQVRSLRPNQSSTATRGAADVMQWS